MNERYTIGQVKETQMNQENYSMECLKTCSEGSFKDISNLVKDNFVNNIVCSSSKHFIILMKIINYGINR